MSKYELQDQQNQEHYEGEQPPSGPPREFWIAGRHDGSLDAFECPCDDYSGYFKAVHVIEKSAYDFWKKRCLDSEDAFEAQAEEYEKVVAELAEAKEVIDDNYHAAKRERERGDFYKQRTDQLRSACEMLAGALKKCIYDSERLEHGQWAVDQANEALAQYERIKRQLAGEK